MLLAGFLTCAVVSLILFLMGYLIWKKEKLSFIAGYDEETYKGDKSKLARSVGLFSMIIAVLTLILPFALEYIGSIGGIIYTIIVIIGTFILVIYVNLLNQG